MTDYEVATAFLGEWGHFQQQVFFLLCLTVIPNGFSGMFIVFVADTPPHRCVIPANVNLTAAWRNHSIPLELDSNSGALVPSKCSRYRLGDVLSLSDRGFLPGVDVNMSNVPTESCLDGWEYDQSVYISTIITEWDLVCDDRWKNPLTSSIFFCGVLTGSFVSGQLSDRFGRKIVLFVTMAIQTVFTFIMVFAPSWPVFCALFFIVGMGQISNYVAAFVLGTEILSPKVRTIYSTAGVSLFFAAGYMFLPLLAYFLRDWRMLLLGLTLPGFLYVPLWWFIPESPRWLLSRGRVEEAEAIVRDAAKKNKIKPPPVIFSPLQNFNARRVRPSTSVTCSVPQTSAGSPSRCGWSALVEIPAYTLSWVMFRWWSRRLSLSSTLFMGGVFLLFVQLMPANLVYLSITLEMMGKCAVTTAFAIVYAYTAELYPTVLRNTALGACSMASRIGSIIAPYFIYLRSYSVSLPYILMGSITVASGLLSLLLPESYGMPLPDTISHMQHFPGCCKKTPYKLTNTEEKEKVAEGTFSLEQGASLLSA
ncbi:solute carrier family 22 member 5-like isoform X2 [Gymnodraco acuticeps]|uniref:Solute carrier family 22 member 5-like isoform X2 n=1 Tax=Gymnodraco acuticeps TaxID=8218 RepID=A0A6P8TVA9_GYMAC|nr:solute carrier family 22 member 5-like isoform X2 [Gymnodraco acuticeps]